MKFVALALALLLAVGSQAASLQADAPSQLQHIRAAADMYLTQVKESAKNVLNGLDGTEYSDLKVNLIQRLDDMHEQIKGLQGRVSPMTDSVVSTISDATAELRESITRDFETLNAELEPKRAQLREVLERHFKEYYAQMEPIMKEYMDKHMVEMEGLKTKMQPVVDELKTKVATNVEETKAALQPILETVRSKLSERLESLKLMAAPYVAEYKEQLHQAMEQAKQVNTDDLQTLKEKITPLADDVKVKMQAIFEAIAASITKN